ncbi:MAG: NAD(P)-binding domain-containing protein [Pseudolabrys sp.]|jgi:cation diffusion facilitator CzcD-associated flavoprotein CzcO
MITDSCDVAIVGAGPYGLATAAHLKSARVPTRAFGDTMAFWRKNMPSGMKLRSPWRASHIIDPDRAHSLDIFADTHGIERTENLSLVDFVRYGEWFQKRAVPDLDSRMVVSVTAGPRGFRLTLNDGCVVEATRIVMAMGLTNQAYSPPEFAGLPSELVSHSSAMVTPGDFRDRHVAVIGRGQSAVESAVLLNEAGAQVDLICRGNVRWLGEEAARPRHGDLLWHLREALQAPSGIGPFPYNWAADIPDVLYRLPPELRKRVAALCLRAAASGWLQPRAKGVRINAGRTISAAKEKGGCIALQLDNGTAEYDHVVLSTGYQIDITRLGVLAPELLSRVKQRTGCPVLSTQFESSVPGLHFVGCSAVGSFGPLPRFVAGCGLAARRVTEAAAAGARRPFRRHVTRPAIESKS